MKLTTLFLTLTVVALLSSPATPQDKEPSNRIKELQKQRIDTLKSVVDLGHKLAQSGRIEVTDAAEDQMALLKAELAVVARPSERIPLYTKAIDALSEYEEMAKARLAAGRGTEYGLLKVRAKRLEVEVLLEQAKEAKQGR